ncbi:MAG: D-threo-aldose 1-dehydrogenase, partial [Actinomycetota bacterium]|nr:D-threo-aldose 1-dehydrogenase [Actinomycetota bacterium]
MAAVADVVALGRGGLLVGRYGFGGAPIGGLYQAVEEREAEECLAEAWARGLRYFDTAPHYGAGLSERRIGAFLASKPRDEWALSTKVGRLLEPAADDAAASEGFVGEPASRRVFDFSRDGVRRSLDASLKRLGVDRVDIVYLHDPDDHWRQAIDDGWPTLAALRDEGVVTSIGAGMKQTPMLTRFVRETDMDVVLLAGRYSLLDQGALDDLLPACLERSVSVVLGGVFNSGVLANPVAGSTFDYYAAPPDVVARAQHIAEVCGRHGVAVPAAALQFPLAHPAITTVLVGSRNAGEV